MGGGGDGCVCVSLRAYRIGISASEFSRFLYGLAHLLYSITSNALLDLPDRECAIYDLPVANTYLINSKLYIHLVGADFRRFRRYRRESAIRGSADSINQ